MKKVQFIILLLLLLINKISFAQNFCFTNSNVPDFLQTIPQNQYITHTADNNYVIRVFFHIIRRSNGTGGQTLANANTAFNILQSDYQTYGICFELLGIDEILNDNYYNANINFYCDSQGDVDCDGDGKFDNFHPNSHSNAIDVYLFADDKFYGGLASNIPGTALAIGGEAYDTYLVTSHVISHEMGHCLGLYHTFHGLCEGGCAEFVNGSNCTSCGDFVCDTPPDPQKHQVNQTTCEWNGTTCGIPNTDAHGDAYNPNTTLLMAYMAPNCMLFHTDGQVFRMKSAIVNSSLLQNIFVPNNLTLSGTKTGTNKYRAKDNITSTQIINSGSTIYEAGEVILNGGFEIKAGSEFEVIINNDCQ